MFESLLFYSGPNPPKPDMLTFSIAKSASTQSFQFYAENVQGVVEYDVPGSYTFNTATPSVLHGTNVPANATKIFVTVKRKSPTGVANWTTETNGFITEILSWALVDPTIGIGFTRCLGLVKVPAVAPPLTNWYGMFVGCWNFNQVLTMWDTKHVTSMAGMFNQATKYNQSLNGWDTRNVTNMTGMFANATAFNGDISQFNVSKVTSLRSMFANCKAYNQNLSNMIFKASADRSYYDEGTTAWLTQNKPKFTGV